MMLLLWISIDIHSRWMYCKPFPVMAVPSLTCGADLQALEWRAEDGMDVSFDTSPLIVFVVSKSARLEDQP